MIDAFAKKPLSKEYCAEMIETELKDMVNMEKKASVQRLGDSRSATI